MARIDDGYSTRIRLAIFGVVLWEKEVTPPSIDGGGPNDTTTMRNLVWRTKAPKKLKTLGEAKVKVAYASAAYNSIVASVNANQLIEIDFPDNSALQFWGWLDKFVPDPIKEGEQPTAEITIQCSNQDNDGNVQAPIFVPAP